MVLQAFDIANAKAKITERAETIPTWARLGYPSYQAWVDAGSPSTPYQAPSFTSGATAATTPEVTRAVEPAPATDVTSGAQAAVVPEAQRMQPQSGGSFLGDVFNTLKDAPATLIPGVGGAIGTALEATGREPTLGGAVQGAYDAYNADIPIYSDFARDTLAPAVGDAAGFAAKTIGPVNAGLGITNAVTGGKTPTAEDVGRFVGESFTPISAGDVALSVFIPQTADWGDIYRIAKGTGLIDDLGRVVASERGGVRLVDILTQYGKRVEDIPDLPIGAAEALVRGTPVDQGTDAARLLSGPGAGREIPAPRPGIAGAAPDGFRSYGHRAGQEAYMLGPDGKVIDADIAIGGHDAQLQKQLGMSLDEALSQGYARVRVADGGINIQAASPEQVIAAARRYASTPTAEVFWDAGPQSGRSTVRDIIGGKVDALKAGAGDDIQTALQSFRDRGWRIEQQSTGVFVNPPGQGASATYDNVEAAVRGIQRDIDMGFVDEVPAGRATPPAGTADVLYHEGPLEDVFSVLPNSGRAGADNQDWWFSTTPDLATSQGGGRGVIMEFDRAGINAVPSSTKPAAGFVEAAGGGSELLLRNSNPPKGSVRAITIKADASVDRVWRTRMETYAKNNGWAKVKNADGSITYTRPATEGVQAAGRVVEPPAGTAAEVPPSGAATSAAPASPPPPRGPATAVDDVPPGGVPPTGAATTSPDPVAKLTDIIDQARPLPAQTEELRKVERSQRIAQSSRILEEGGFSGDAFQQAKGPLAGEYSRAAFDPPNVNFQPEEVQQFRNMIRDTEGLRTFEKINTNEALNAVLEGRLNEIRPFEIGLLDKVYGSKFSLAVAMKAAPPSFADKVYEWWLSSILSGPMTQMRNIVGNTAAAMTAPVERLGAAALDPFVARATGRQTERFWQEAPEQVIGMIHGIPEGVTGALKAMRGGFAESALTESASRAPAIGGLKGRIIRAPLTMLEVMDSFFGAVNYEGAYRALAVRAARKEGLTGQALQVRIADLLANRTDDLIDAATQEKLVRLFRDEPTRVGQAIMSARNTYKPLRFLVPFARTPDRLLAYGIKRSPLGLLDFPMWQRLAKGNPAAVDELAQTLMGSTVAMALGALVANGQLDITGAFPTDAATRDRLYREGKQPFSVKMPGIGWVQYSQIPGLDTALTTLASAKESFESGEGIDKAVGDLGANIAANIFDRSYVSGLADFMEIFSGGGYEDPADAAIRWASRQASGAVPYGAFSRQTGQFFDQTVYKPQGVAENIATGIGLGGVAGVPERQTAFGETSSRAFPSPISVSPDRQSAVDAELENVGVEIGFTGKSIAGVGLTREQQALYQTVAGQLTYQALDAIVQSPAYQALSTGDKVKVIEKARDKARDMVRDPINKLVDSDGWEQLTPAQQKQVIDAALNRDPQEMLQLMGR